MDDVWYWDFMQHSWTLVPAQPGGPPARFGHAALGYGSKALVHGGKATLLPEGDCVLSGPWPDRCLAARYCAGV